MNALSRLALSAVLLAPSLHAGGSYTDLGNGLPGSAGPLVLNGTGSLQGGHTMGLALTGALPNAPLWVIVGVSELNVPFKGGVLVPSPDFVLGPLLAGAAGDFAIETTWPFGLPLGSEVAFQIWAQDASGPAGFASSNGLRATTPTQPVPGTFPNDWIFGGDCANDPPIQVHAYNESTFLLRQSMCTNFEAPFMFLLMGQSRAMLLDSGAGGIPIRNTVEALIAQYEATHNVSLDLVVTHTHSHGDHVAGDGQFNGQPQTTVVGTSQNAVESFYGFNNWPLDNQVLDLGGRKLDIIGIPGHQAQSVAMYDRETGLLLTGDSLYPGFIFLFGAVSQGNWGIYANSMSRLRAFSESVPVTHVLGTHVEMTSTPGVAYPYGTNNQPLERVLELGLEHVQEVDDAMQTLPGPQQDVHDDFILTPNG